jgi:hypothetical protein
MASSLIVLTVVIAGIGTLIGLAIHDLVEEIRGARKDAKAHLTAILSAIERSGQIRGPAPEPDSAGASAPEPTRESVPEGET